MKLELSASLNTLTIICNPKSIIFTDNQSGNLSLPSSLSSSLWECSLKHVLLLNQWTPLTPWMFCYTSIVLYTPRACIAFANLYKSVLIRSLRYIEMIVHKKILAWFQTTPSLILRSRRSLIESDRVQTSCRPGRWRWVKQTEISSWNPVKIFKSPPHLKAKQCTMCNIIYSTQEAKETFIQMNTYNSL